MQILKGKKDRTPDFNQYVDTRPDLQVFDLDKKVNQRKANLEGANSLKFDEWKDTDGSVFPSYSQLLDYQTDKFCSTYPPPFAREIRPFLTSIIDEKIVWNWEAVRIFMNDTSEFYRFVRELKDVILKHHEFNIEKFQYDINLHQIKEDVLKLILNKYKEEALKESNKI